MTLLEQARAEGRHDRRNYDHLMPVIHELRAKGWTYLAIQQWLIDRGANVHPKLGTFAGAVCKRYRHWLDKQALRK